MKNKIQLLIVISLGLFSIAAMAPQEIQITGPDSADKIFINSLDEKRALVSVLDADDNPIHGLQEKDFSVKKGSSTGKISSVSPLESTEDVPLNIVLVVDNSLSMQQRKAVEPLLNALEELYPVFRPIDNVHAIVFDDNKTTPLSGKMVHARSFASNNIDELRTFFSQSFTGGLTKKTYLYDSMMLGLDITRQMPEKSNKFLIVFTDGEDINSTFSTSAVEDSAGGVSNLSAYSLDFMEGTSTDFFLRNFSESHSGKIWKAESSAELSPIFKSVSNRLRHQYVINYRFLSPPTGTLAFEPANLIIEEVTTIDSSPFLNYVFFEEGKSDISDEYVLFTRPEMTRDYSEQKLGGPMEKYRNILNTVGKRLQENPGAGITIEGCNSNMGPERNNIALSKKRAEAVQGYLKDIWSIDPSRIEVKARNLPEVPSARTTKAGIAENRRVEIHSADPAILDIVKSTYAQKITDTAALLIKPQIQSDAGIARWKVDLKGSDKTVIDSVSGKGDIGSAVTFNLVPAGLSRIASFKTLTAGVEVTDNEGAAFKDENAAITNVTYIRKEAQTAEKRGERILERYTLILFEYDKADIREHNKAVIDRLVARMKDLPDADVRIVGHTDSTGSENYNLRLSERRARAVYDQILAAGLTARKNVTYTGVGLHHPPYDNSQPEGRALNRTVIVTLDYEEKI